MSKSTLNQHFENRDFKQAYSYVINFPHLATESLNAVNCSPFHEFCLNVENTASEVERLMILNPGVAFVRGKNGYFPMHMIASRGGEYGIAIFNLLFDANPESLRSRCSNGRTPLHFAAQNGHFDLVVAMLEKQPSVAAVMGKDGRYALHLSVLSGNAELVEAVYDAYPDAVKASAQGGFTPLFVACEYGHAAVVERLLDWYPEALGVATHQTITCLDIAISKHHIPVIEAILRKKPALAVSLNPNQQPPLLLACYHGSIPLVQSIYAVNAESIKVTDYGGVTCFHIAAQGNHGELFDYLADLNPEPIKWLTLDQMSCLHFGLQNPDCSLRIVARIVNTCPELCSQISRNDLVTPLHLACRNGNSAITRLILKTAPSTMCKLSDEGSIPMLALFMGRNPYDYDLVREMIELYPESPFCKTIHGSSDRFNYSGIGHYFSFLVEDDSIYNWQSQTTNYYSFIRHLLHPSPPIDILRLMTKLAKGYTDNRMAYKLTGSFPSSQLLSLCEMDQWIQLNKDLNWRYRKFAFLVTLRGEVENKTSSKEMQFLKLFQLCFINNRDMWRVIVSFL